MKYLFLLCALVLMVGCSEEKKKAPVERTLLVQVETIAEHPPVFARRYSAQINDQVSIELTRETYTYSARFGYIKRQNDLLATLKQSDGRTVHFNPDKVAEYILEPSLVKPIELYVQQIYEFDQQFMDSKPDRFVDLDGHEWRRQP